MTLTPACPGAYIQAMRHRIAFVLALALTAPPALAEEPVEGRSMMEQGIELFMEGLRQEMAPAVEDLRGLAEKVGPSMRSFLEEMGPALAEMMDDVQDWTRYEPPEMLPNGDIIIRRKPEAAPEPKAAPEAAPEPAPEPEQAEPSSPTDI